jgi:hypothetical protein
MIRVVGIHGIGNYSYFRNLGSAPAASAAISRAWSEWLADGIAGIAAPNLHVAYYSHCLHRGTPQSVDDVAILGPVGQDLLIAWVRELQPVSQIAQGPRTAQARQAVDWVTRHFGLLTGLSILTFCREVETYLSASASPRRLAAREIVAEAISQYRPGVIIAHSLGSVVAYETLWAYPALSTVTLITIGSPLAMPTLLNRLIPQPVDSRGRRPPPVTRWVNVADCGDIVAIPRGGLGQRFDDVEDAADVVIGSWDFHSAEGYLRCPDVARYIL